MSTDLSLLCHFLFQTEKSMGNLRNYLSALIYTVGYAQIHQYPFD